MQFRHPRSGPVDLKPSLVFFRSAGLLPPAGAMALLWLGWSLLLGCGPTSVPTVQLIAGKTMGTSYSIKLVPDASMPSLGNISQRVESELALVNDQMSTYIASSELSRFNDQTTTDWFEVSQDTAAVTQQALEIYQLTDGAFDVTVGPLVDAWGFGPNRRSQSVPTDKAIAEILKFVGSDKLEVRLQPPALRKSVPELRVDLSAIAKGHGVDRIAQVLDSLGIQAYFVEIGGEVRTRGKRIDGKPWQVGIEQPSEDQRAVHTVVGISDRSLATSGDYRNFYNDSGHRYTHFIDPHSGRPIEGEMASASVIADNCALADALATSLMSVGFDKGLKLAETHGWAVLLIARHEDQLVTATSSRFRELLPDTATVPEGARP